jgi:putative tryptophan/tyrosine transport system substrate-binding protein
MALCRNSLSRSLLGAKRTCPFALHMSAFDPKRAHEWALPVHRFLPVRLAVLALGATMRRRDFIKLFAGAVTAWPLSANAQRAENLTRIGFLPVGTPSNPYDRSLVDAFRQGLREVGVIENRDVVLDIIWIGAEAELPQAVSDLVRRGAKLLIPVGTSASVAVKRGVSTIPILFINVGNPVGVGLVESLARPGANVTGFSDMHADLSGKYVQFARELGEPQGAVNYLWYTEWADGQNRFQATERAAQSLGVMLRSRGIRDIAEADDVLAAMKADGAVTVIIQSSPFVFRHRGRLIAAAMNYGLATIFPFPPAARDGALIAYGPDYVDLYRRAASYAERILNGTKPADLPVEQPTKFELVINLNTAKTLGLKVPPSLLASADELID